MLLFSRAFPLAMLVLASAACAHEAPPAPVTATAKTPPPTTPPAVRPRIVVVSPNVRVSAELAELCKLRFDNVGNAPKFDFDESTLDVQDNAILAQIGDCVTKGPLAGRSLELVGRADPRGRESYNMALGDRRAETVRTFLVKAGVPALGLAITSRGEKDATGTDEPGWERDRRVDIVLR